jgi:TolA-binding protein
MRSFKLYILTIVVVSSSWVSFAAAQEASGGRLSDGRAYRTNADGFEVIDHLAELERTVDELRRKISGMQYQLDQKDALIKRLNQNGGTDVDLVERDLLARRSDTVEVVEGAPLHKNECQCPPVQKVIDLTACPELDCDPQLQKVHELLEHARNELKAVKVALTQSEAKLTQTKNSLGETKTALANSQALLVQAQKGKGAAELACADQAQTRATEITRLQNELQQERRNIESLQLALAGAAEIKEKPVQKLEADFDNTARFGFNSDRVPAKNEPSASVVRGRVESELKKLRTLITARDKLYERYRRAKGYTKVGLKLTRLVSSRGFTVGRISAELRQPASVELLRYLERDVKEIKRKVLQDHARLKKLR